MSSYPLFSFLIVLLACWIPFANSIQAIVDLTAQSDSLFVAQAKFLDFYTTSMWLFFSLTTPSVQILSFRGLIICIIILVCSKSNVRVICSVLFLTISLAFVFLQWLQNLQVLSIFQLVLSCGALFAMGQMVVMADFFFQMADSSLHNCYNSLSWVDPNVV